MNYGVRKKIKEIKKEVEVAYYSQEDVERLIIEDMDKKGYIASNIQIGKTFVSLGLKAICPYAIAEIEKVEVER